MDIGTLSFSGVLIGAALALITITMAAFRRKRGPIVFAAAFVAASLGFLLFLLQDGLPPLIGIIAPNLLLLCFQLGLAWGLRIVLGFERPWPLRFFAYFAVWLVVLCLSTFYRPSALLRTALSSLFITLSSAEFLSALHRGPRRVPFVVKAAVSSFVVVFIGLHLSRFALLALSDGFGFSLSADTFINTYTFVFSIFASVLWAGSILGIDAADLVAELESKNEMLRNLAAVDELTGLSNRRMLDTMLQAEIDRSERYGDPLSFILFDIDYFKGINDTWGHRVGDDVLKELAAETNSRIREPDCLFRWGGDEFVVVAPHTALEGAIALADHMRQDIEARDFPKVGSITLSCGVAEWTPRVTAAELFAYADEALYKAKTNGRNRVVASRASIDA